MILGFIILLAVIAYLFFLWFGRNSGSFWSRIVLSNWATTSVVISALVIRVVVKTQMALITSVLALATMKTGVTLNKISRISSIRYSNAGPLELLHLLFGSAKYCLSPPIFLLALLSGFLTILLQFSSTLLVSDLATNPVETPANISGNAVMPPMEENTLLEKFYTDAFVSSEPTYPIFAEFSNRGERSNDPRIDDTDPIIRALLPVSAKAHRSRIHSFEGNASIYDARWICSQPNVTNINLVGTHFEGMYLTGNLQPSILVPPMVTANQSVEFNCSLYPTTSISGSWTLVTCPVYNSAFGLIRGIDTAYDTTKVQTLLSHNMTITVEQGTFSAEIWLPFDPEISINDGYFNFPAFIGDTYLLVIVSNITTPEHDNIVGSPDSSEYKSESAWYFAFNDSRAWNSNGIGSWTRLESTHTIEKYASGSSPEFYFSASQSLSLAIDVSFCSSAFTSVKNVHVKAHERQSRMSRSQCRTEFSRSVLQVIVMTRKSVASLQLDEARLYEQLESERAEIVRSNPYYPINPVSNIFNQGSLIMPLVNRAWYPVVRGLAELSPVHENRAGLFQQIIQKTGSPALAMQAM